jgi:hypothetical protein
VNKLDYRKLADGALNARLPRHFAHGRNNDRARRWGFRGDFQGGTKGRRNAMRPSPSPLEPPLEVLETFGGAKVSDKRVTSNEAKNPKKQTISK